MALLKSWLLEALWQGLYRCSISVDLLPDSILSSFNGQISLRFLLNLFFLGREDLYVVMTRHYQEKGQLGRVSSFGGSFFPLGYSSECHQMLEDHLLLVLTFKYSPLAWKGEDIQNYPSEKEYRMHLVICGRGELPLILKMGGNLKANYSRLFISQMGNLRPFEAQRIVQDNVSS